MLLSGANLMAGMDYRILAFIVMLLWGVQNVLLKVVFRKISPFGYYVIAGIATIVAAGLAYFLFKPSLNVDSLTLGGAFLLALFVSLTYLAFLYALSIGPENVVIPITSLNVAVTAILATIFLKEPMTVEKALGLLFATVAVVLLSL